jgi:hypothetical protein
MFFTKQSITLKYIKLVFGQKYLDDYNTSADRWFNDISKDQNMYNSFFEDKDNLRSKLVTFKEYLQKQQDIIRRLSKEIHGDLHHHLTLENDFNVHKQKMFQGDYTKTIAIIGDLFNSLKVSIQNLTSFTEQMNPTYMLENKSEFLELGKRLLSSLTDLHSLVEKVKPEVQKLIAYFKSQMEVYSKTETELIKIERDIENF